MSNGGTFLQVVGGIFLIWMAVTGISVVAYAKIDVRPRWISILMFGSVVLAIVAAFVTLAAAAGVA